MGTVYLAQDLEEPRTLAIKVARHAEERLRREFQATTRLSAPGIDIVKPVEFCAGNAVRGPFLVMEHLPGRDLLQYRGHPQRLQDAAALLHPVARAVQHMHSAGWVHRDITPGNIIYDFDAHSPRVTLVDFGLSKCFQPEITDSTLEATELTLDHTLIGSPCYISPEQLKSLQSVGPPGDVYMLASTLYFLLTGTPPFPHRSFSEDYDDFPELAENSVARSEEAREILRASTAKNPEQRVSSAAFAEMLQKHLSPGQRPTTIRVDGSQGDPPMTTTSERLPVAGSLELQSLLQHLPFDRTSSSYGNDEIRFVPVAPRSPYLLGRLPQLDLAEFHNTSLQLSEDGTQMSLISDHWLKRITQRSEKAFQRIFGPGKPLRLSTQRASVLFERLHPPPAYSCDFQWVKELSLGDGEALSVPSARLVFSRLEPKVEPFFILHIVLDAGDLSEPR